MKKVCKSVLFFAGIWQKTPPERGNGARKGPGLPLPGYSCFRQLKIDPERQSEIDPPHVRANTPGVFDQTGGHFHLNGAQIGVSRKSGAGKYPDSGCSELEIDVGFWVCLGRDNEDGKRL